MNDYDAFLFLILINNTLLHLTLETFEEHTKITRIITIEAVMTLLLFSFVMYTAYVAA